MVKKRNKRTRKKYKKKGGFTDDELNECNNRLKRQGVKGMVNRRTMCVKSNAKAGLPTQEPSKPKPSIKDRGRALGPQLDFPDQILKIKLVPSKLFNDTEGIIILKNEEKKGNVECSKLSNTKCKISDNCDLVIKRIKGNTNNKRNKIKKCLPKTVGGKRRTKRKKSRKRRR